MKNPASSPLAPPPKKMKNESYSGPTKLLINNQWVDAVSKKTFPTFDPSTKKQIAEVAEADKADVDIAVKAARVAFQSWRLSKPAARCALLHKLADLLEENADEIARIESMDNGKPAHIARAVDLPLSIECLRYYAGWTDKLTGQTIPINTEHLAMTVLEPVGVCGQIIPWNFPLLMWAWKIGPAIACGNTIVMKPAEQTPLTALLAGELCVKAGFPPGVINILPGFGPTAGAAISSHPDIDKVAFTGSGEVGRIIMKAAADSNLKAVTLELGGKSPLVIFDDADIDQALAIAHFGLFFNQGQCCCASSRIYVQEGIYEEFCRRAGEIASKKVLGDPRDPKTDYGPQVDEEQYSKILKFIEEGKKQGAKLLCGGGAGPECGFFVQPTVFADVHDDMTIAREEIFGPVMSLIKFKDMAEVIKRANDTKYGLAAGVCTKDITQALTFAKNVRAGTVWINCYDVLTAPIPFGGFKESGIGRELGEYGLRQYSEVKAITISLPHHTANIQKEAD